MGPTQVVRNSKLTIINPHVFSGDIAGASSSLKTALFQINQVLQYWPHNMRPRMFSFNNSSLPQPIFMFNMPLEPHCNVDFKTGAGIDFLSKNLGVMSKKLKLI